MPEELQTLFLSIYTRIAPQFNIPHLSVKVEKAPYPEIVLSSEPDQFYVCLSLYSETNEEEDINTYRWEYMDCYTGAIIKSDLTHEATDEAVIEFFHYTVKNDDSVMDLPQ